MSVLVKMAVLVALLSCVSAMSHTIEPTVHMMPTEREFNILDSDNDGEVSRHEFVERYLKFDELRSRSSVDGIDLRLATTGNLYQSVLVSPAEFVDQEGVVPWEIRPM